MAVGLEFPFVPRAAELGAASLAPMLPLTLAANRSVAVSGLLDTGAAVNVLPYSTGVDLGFDWDRQTTAVQLSGNLSIVEFLLGVRRLLLPVSPGSSRSG